jgi:hypothetical protein
MDFVESVVLGMLLGLPFGALLGHLLVRVLS